VKGGYEQKQTTYRSSKEVKHIRDRIIFVRRSKCLAKNGLAYLA
jgi:hypothetical protein